LQDIQYIKYLTSNVVLTGGEFRQAHLLLVLGNSSFSLGFGNGFSSITGTTGCIGGGGTGRCFCFIDLSRS